jgi:DNA-binding transcriptional MerR regulator
MNKGSNTSRRGIKTEILKLHNLGFSYTQIQKQLNCSRGTISHHLSSFIQEQKEIHKENKTTLINEIKSNLPQTKQDFDKLYSDKLTSREIQFFYNSFYKKVNLGTTKDSIPKEYYSNKRYQIKKELVDYKGGCCEICGYNKSLRALQFHHINPKEKDFNIGGVTTLNESVKNELNKCILVCANCHSEIHDNNIRSDARVVE